MAGRVMTACIDCGLHQPVIDRPRCYSCDFHHDEELALIEARRVEWWTNESGEVTC
jgi:hypothetical protein